MASVNKVILVGNLGQDPEVRYTPSGAAVANFSIATTDRWTNKQSGQPEERTEWHRIVVWNKLAELCKEYLHKGRAVYVEGRLQTRSWEDKDGNKRSTTEIVAQTIQFLGNRERAASGDYQRSTPTAEPGQSPSQSTPTSTDNGPPPFGEDNDIPF